MKSVIDCFDCSSNAMWNMDFHDGLCKTTMALS